MELVKLPRSLRVRGCQDTWESFSKNISRARGQAGYTKQVGIGEVQEGYRRDIGRI